MAKPLDREVTDVLKISVLAVDDGEPQRSDHAEVEFFLTDVNDNSPVIRPQKSEASVFEVLIRLSCYFNRKYTALLNSKRTNRSKYIGRKQKSNCVKSK